MGLDMYLEAEEYISSYNLPGEVGLTPSEKLTQFMKQLNFNTPGIVKGVSYELAYWRKANQIHKWFVDNVQDGIDECQRSHVSSDKLRELLSLCKTALETKDPTLLPPQEGFFFGSTEIDEGYWQDLKDTVKMLEPTVQYLEDHNLVMYYHSSW